MLFDTRSSKLEYNDYAGPKQARFSPYDDNGGWVKKVMLLVLVVNNSSSKWICLCNHLEYMYTIYVTIIS